MSLTFLWVLIIWLWKPVELEEFFPIAQISAVKFDK